MAELKSLTPITSKDNNELLDAASAAALFQARIDLNLKQEAVAAHVGISQPYLHELERGTRRLRAKMFHRIKAALEALA